MSARTLIVGGLLLAGACSQPDARAKASLGLAGETLCAFEARRPNRTEVEVAQRMQGIAAIVTGRSDLNVADFDAFVVNQSAGETRGPSGALLPWIGAPVDGLVVSYHPEVDDLLVARPSAPASMILAAPDHEEPRARELATAALDQLSAVQILDPQRYDRANPELALTRMGLKAPGEDVREFITEYTYMWLQTHGGVPFANAGVRITIDRLGTLARIRVGEVFVSSENHGGTEVPTGRGFCFQATTDKVAVDARFAAQVPDGRMVESRRMYVVPGGTEAGVVEPLQVVMFVRAFENHDGALPNISRKNTWGYSLRETGAQAVDLAPPASVTSPGQEKP